jgi:hypothetical protein
VPRLLREWRHTRESGAPAATIDKEHTVNTTHSVTKKLVPSVLGAAAAAVATPALAFAGAAAMTRTLFLDLGSDAMNDVFLVISEARNGKPSARCVLAGDETQARDAHLEHYPDEQIVAVRVPPRTPA